MDDLAGCDQRRAVSVSACAVPAGAIRIAGDGAADAAAPAHWRTAGGGLWGAGGGDRGPARGPLRAGRRSPAGRTLLAADGGESRVALCLSRSARRLAERVDVAGDP